MNNKFNIDDIDRSLYDFKYDDKDFYRSKEGITPEIVQQLSEDKNDPEWMREFRLKSLDLYYKIPVPNWGPSIDGLDMDHIATYVRPNTNMKDDWDRSQDIKDPSTDSAFPRRKEKLLPV